MKKLLSFIVLQLSLLPPLNSQQIRYVKPSASGSGDGSSWTNASVYVRIVNTDKDGQKAYSKMEQVMKE